MALASRLVLGARSVTAGLAADTLSTAASTFIARLTTPSTRRQKTIDKFCRALDKEGILTRFYHAWLLNADVQGNSLLDLVATTDATIGGTPTFTANSGWTGSTSNYLDTGWNPSTAGIDITDFSLSLYSESGTANASSDLGLFDSTNGITFNTNTGTAVTFRLNGTLRTSSNFSTKNDGSGMFTASVKSNVASLYRNGVLLETAAYTPAAAVSLTLHLLKINGAASSSGRKLGFVAVGQSLNADQVKQLYNAFYTYREMTTSGDLLTYEPGVGASLVGADLIVYGATAQGVLSAYAAKRMGLSVAICGGWRESHLGGMSSGGLGALDLSSIASIGGLPRYVMTRINTIAGNSDVKNNFEPRVFERVMRELVDPARTGGLDIPIYWSTGVDQVYKSGTIVTGWHTRDGRVFRCREWIDASYELDLAYRAGCTTTLGREAAGTGTEAINGYRGVTSASGGGNHQFKNISSGNSYNIDPYRTAGVSASGLLAGVAADPGLTPGQADTSVQGYCFRLALSNAGKRATVWGAGDKPPNYDINTYEPMLRFFDALTTDGKTDSTDYSALTSDFWSLAATGTNVFDANNGGSMSLDYTGSRAYDYIVGSYDDRERIWQQYRLYQQGWLYTINKGRSVELDTRVPAAVETDWNAYGLDRQHFTDPYPGDPAWWPYQLYVREGRRLVGDFVLDGNDVTATDATAPRSTKTVAAANYLIDSHHALRIADLSGTPRLWNIGEINIASGGTDGIAPIPYEAILPKRADCTNGAVTFGISCTHVAFSMLRMEFPTMAIGQAAGVAAALAIKNNVAMQDVDYTALRSALLASPSLSGEVVPVIPLVN